MYACLLCVCGGGDNTRQDCGLNREKALVTNGREVTTEPAALPVSTSGYGRGGPGASKGQEHLPATQAKRPHPASAPPYKLLAPHWPAMPLPSEGHRAGHQHDALQGHPRPPQ